MVIRAVDPLGVEVSFFSLIKERSNAGQPLLFYKIYFSEINSRAIYELRIMLKEKLRHWLLKAFVITLLVISLPAISQNGDYRIKHEYAKAPKNVSKSPIKLAKYLTAQDSSQFQQALNIYTWIINNIADDVKVQKKKRGKAFTPQQTLRRGKGICYQYSDIFATLSQNAGISTREITSYSRGFDYQEDDLYYEADHSWNGIKLESYWYFVDATWGSGGLVQKKKWLSKLMFRFLDKPYVNDRYKFFRQPSYDHFLIQPDVLIKDHLTVDPTWQLVAYPISLATFEANDWEGYQNEVDSLYLRQMEEIEYGEKLDKYEYLSGLQYLAKTAEESHLYNSRNSRMLGYSFFNMARSEEHVQGKLGKRVAACESAIGSYKSAINHFSRHQRSAVTISKRMTKESKKHISRALIIPISNRIRVNNKKIKETAKSMEAKQKKLDSRYNKIVIAEKYYRGRLASLRTQLPAKRLRPEVLAKN